MKSDNIYYSSASAHRELVQGVKRRREEIYDIFLLFFAAAAAILTDGRVEEEE